MTLSRSLALTALASIATTRAHATPSSDPRLGFAPADTDIVLCADITSLEATLAADHTAFSDGATARLQQLRSQLPIEKFGNLKIRSLCTFHVRNTENQLAVLEFDGTAPTWIKKKLVVLNKRQFLPFSGTSGLVARSTWITTSRLAPALAEATDAVLGNNYWSVMELTDAVRKRLVANTGATDAHAVPELARLQQVRFVFRWTGSNDLDVEIGAKYGTAEDAGVLGIKLKPWIPIAATTSAPDVTGTLVTYHLSHVSYQKLNAFLSQF